MIQTETSKAKIIFVSVPNDATNFHFALQQIRLWYDTSDSKNYSEELPQGNWTILNVLDDVTEDEAKIVVNNPYRGYYYEYLPKGAMRLSNTAANHPFDTAKESLHSLATSLGVEGKTIIIYQLK